MKISRIKINEQTIKFKQICLGEWRLEIVNQ